MKQEMEIGEELYEVVDERAGNTGELYTMSAIRAYYAECAQQEAAEADNYWEWDDFLGCFEARAQFVGAYGDLILARGTKTKRGIQDVNVRADNSFMLLRQSQPDITGTYDIKYEAECV